MPYLLPQRPPCLLLRLVQNHRKMLLQIFFKAFVILYVNFVGSLRAVVGSVCLALMWSLIQLLA
jgi:hypothetical protein